MVLTAWTQTASLLSFFYLFFSSCKCMLRVRSVFALGFDITSRVLPHPVLLIKPKTLNVERLTCSHWTGFCYLEAKGSFKEPFGWEASRYQNQPSCPNLTFIHIKMIWTTENLHRLKTLVRSTTVKYGWLQTAVSFK